MHICSSFSIKRFYWETSWLRFENTTDMMLRFLKPKNSIPKCSKQFSPMVICPGSLIFISECEPWLKSILKSNFSLQPKFAAFGWLRTSWLILQCFSNALYVEQSTVRSLVDLRNDHRGFKNKKISKRLSSRLWCTQKYHRRVWLAFYSRLCPFYFLASWKCAVFVYPMDWC